MGSCVAACSVAFQEVVTPDLAESIAARKALSFALEEGMESVILATDCLSIVRRINSKAFDRSGCGPVIEDIKHLLAKFPSSSICHVRHEQNVAAHLLARSSEQLVCRVWCGVPPDCIRETICCDFMSS